MERTAMHATVFRQLSDDEARRILHWRFDSLVRAGYEEREALIVATHVDVDLHRAVELVGRGCPPPTALRILL
jgi:hypothetical protein